MIPREILKKVRNIRIRSRRIVTDVFAGQYHSAFKGQGMEFEEVREYVPGDDIRTIDWNVTARAGHPFIKKFREERELTVMLVVDISASHAFGSGARLKKDIAAELACILAFAAIRNNDKVGLILHTGDVEKHIPPGKGVRHVLRVVSEVLNFKPVGTGTRVAPALDYLNHVVRRRCVAFLIGDFLADEDWQRPLTVTARRHDLAALIVADRREKDFPAAGLVEWQDAETGARVLIDTSHPEVRRKLPGVFARRREALMNRLTRSGVDSIEISTTADYERDLATFFRSRASRARNA
ncbi:MAG: DUF58 domain-containing protein [Kiritimatiellia bacterium]